MADHLSVLYLNVNEGSEGDTLVSYLADEANYGGVQAFCLQEATHLLLDKLKPHFWGGWQMRYGQRDIAADPYGHGNVLLIRDDVPIVKVEAYVIKPEVKNTRNSCIQLADLLLDNKPLTLVNIHGLTHLGKDNKKDTEDRIQFMRGLTELFLGNYPLLLGGDYNACWECDSLHTMGEKLGTFNWFGPPHFNITRGPITKRNAEREGWEYQPESDWIQTRNLCVEFIQLVHADAVSDHRPMKMTISHLQTPEYSWLAKNSADIQV